MWYTIIMRKLAKHEIAAYKDWYARANRVLIELYGGDSDLFAALLAATSPRMSVKRNWRLAKQVYHSWKNGGPINLNGTLPAHHGNIERAFVSETLSGPKVESFRKNLLGDYNAVTIDVWMKRWLGIDKRLTLRRYEIAAGAIREQALDYRLKPAEFQAVAWCVIRRDYGFKVKSFALEYANDSGQLKLWDD